MPDPQQDQQQPGDTHAGADTGAGTMPESEEIGMYTGMSGTTPPEAEPAEGETP